MYVVRRAFRNYGQMMAPGSIVEPGTVKRFKSRLNDGHIVDVHEQDVEKWKKYFKERIGVDIDFATGGIPTNQVNFDCSEPEKQPEKEPEKQPEKEPEKVAKVVKPTATVVVKAH